MPGSAAPSHRRALWILVLATAALHLVLAWHLELTSDECNGWMYARFPAPGYFDHPPLWGFVIRWTTLGATVASELAVRLGAVLLSAATTVLLYRFAAEMAGPEAGWYAALLHNLSLLFTGIGTLMLPDAPLYFFWLLTLYCLAKGFRSETPGAAERRWVLIAGVPLGLALLSKYHAALLIAGVGLYLLGDRTRRAWLLRPEPWIALATALVMFLPVVFWNYEHDWVSLRFQGARMASEKTQSDWTRLAINLIAPILYLNPYVFVCLVGGVVSWARHTLMPASGFALLVWVALPLIVFFAVTSVTNEASLPHWAGVGYFTLLPIGAVWLRARLAARHTRALITRPALASALVFVVLLGFGLVQLDLGVLDLDARAKTSGAEVEAGEHDPTTEMLGWRELSGGLAGLMEEDRAAGLPPATLLFAHRWYNAVRLDFYGSARLGLGTACFADLDQERALAFMRPASLAVGATGYFVVPSNRFRDPRQYAYGKPIVPLAKRFRSIGPPRTIDVVRRGHLAKRFYVYRCEGLRKPPPPPLPAPDLAQRPEYRLFFAVNHDLRSRVSDWLLGYSNWLGAGYVSGPLALVVAWLSWRRRPGRWRGDVAAIVIAATMCMILVTTIKGLCARERPARLFAPAIAAGEVDLHVMFAPKRHQGFPSGHTATAFLIATLLAGVVRRRAIGVVAFALAILVGISTMYIGAHLPADVLAGALVGITTAAFALRFVSGDQVSHAAPVG